jgi:hypothetical protein
MSTKPRPPRAPKDNPLTTIPRGQATLDPLPSLLLPLPVLSIDLPPKERPRRSPGSALQPG